MKYLAILFALVVLFPWRVMAGILVVVIVLKVAGLIMNPTTATLGGSGGSKWGNN